jgi:hypothetical protein
LRADIHTNLTLNSAALHRPIGPPQPVELRRQRPGAVLQILQVAVPVERPAGMRYAWQRLSQVCRVHGRASSGLGQQVHLQPLPNILNWQLSL